ncbi:MAG: hypothetical protein R3240_06505, partial [Gammaproteobacteria bacterium]|nr:hypothetical protein [Gammaproteobacteria bacterium]
MSLTLIFPSFSKAKIGTLALDASLQENHKLSSKVTSFPIENGSIVSDHILNNPITVSIEGFVTDSPVRYLSGVRELLTGISGSGSPSKTAFEKLVELR